LERALRSPDVANTMRRLVLICALLFSVWLPASAAAAPTIVIRVSANSVAFYYDKFALKADGNVRAVLPNGVVVTGQTLVMDFRNNRMLVAGAVRLQAGSQGRDGAAFSDDFDNRRAYFLSAPPSAKRSTFNGDDLTHADTTAQQPADAFAIESFALSVPTILGRRVTIGTRSFMRFGSCRVAPVGGVRFYVPLPSLYVNFSKDPNLAQTTLAAANAGAKIKFTGNTNATTALALNYASTTKFGVGFEQNAIWSKGWGALSVFPFNQSSKFFSAVVSDAPSQTFGFQASSLYNTYPSGNGLPASTAHFSYLQLTQSLHDAYLQLNYQTAPSDLLAPPPQPLSYGSAYAIGPSHPSSVQIGLNSSTLRIGQVLDANVQGGYAYNHNGDGLQRFGGVDYTTVWSPYAGLALFTPDISFGRGGLNSPYLVLSGSDERSWNSLPHYVDQVSTQASLTKPLRIGSIVFGYGVHNVKDVYAGGQRLAYPVLSTPQDPGYAAFEGFSTFRTLLLGFVYAPNPFFALSVSGEQHTDFPAPSPTLFTPVQATVLGVNPVDNYLGQPPYSLPVRVRIRVNPSLSINVENNYYFNYFGNKWSGFQVQFLP
jgi:hypothetical protein